MLPRLGKGGAVPDKRGEARTGGLTRGYLGQENKLADNKNGVQIEEEII